MNLAERLDFAANDRVLILHADDVGSTHAANAATFECLDHGSLTSGSILVPAAWFPEVADYARRNPNADLGVHLTVNCEYSMYRWRALTDRSAAPGLYDEEGYLWRTVADSAAHISPEEAEIELRAQIDKAIAAGIDVTHIDTHMTEFMLQSKFLDAYVSLGLQYRLPMIIFRPNPERLRKAGLAHFWNALEPQIKRLDDVGFPVIDHVFPSQFQGSAAERPAYFSNIFENLRPGVTHFLVHPTRPSEEVAAMMDGATFRAAEFEHFRDRSVAEELARLGVHTITYKEIRQAYREGKLR